MKSARNSTSIIVFVSAITLSYAIAQFSDGMHTRSPAPLTLSQIRPINGTIYSSQGDPRTADPARIAKDTGRSRGDSIVFTGCAPAANASLTAQRYARMCSRLREVDRSLYLFEFASDVHRSQGVLAEPSHP